MEKYLEKAQTLFADYAPKIVTALAILIIGLFVIKLLVKMSRKVMKKAGVDLTLQKFLGNLLGWALKILLIVTVISQLGVETTSFAAILAAAGLAIGLALQGSLANFAGGVLIMIFKPFKLGDLVEAQGAKVVGATSTKGYTFEKSGGVKNGNFVGLMIDEENQNALTDERVNNWVKEIKKKFG